MESNTCVFCFALGSENDRNYQKKFKFFYRDELIKCLAQPTHILIASNV